ncbi:MAG: polysaccharide deacetylase family protein [Gemmatimonadetes bacterium]|nr:polysaccharide deacetylase family protein [Gemmatimonadota bacterium]
MPRFAVRVGLALGGTLVLVAVLHTLATSRTYQLFGRLVAHVPRATPIVALTFDDGPTEGPLDSLLATLAAHEVRATFFVTGRELAAAPHAARRLVQAGHELGNHTYSHRHMVLRSPRTIRREIETTDSLIRVAGYPGPIYFRPPYGTKLLGLPWYLARHHRTSVTWDVEPDSYREVSQSAEGIVRHVLARVGPGSIILLHPWYRSRATSLAAVGPLLDSLQARGYRVVPLRELLGE